jgi:SLOG cluster3 family
VKNDIVLPAPELAGVTVFLSASIPDASRWNGDFDALEITDAVVAITRSVLSVGAQLITAAHPTIAPLLLYVAAELPSSALPRVVVYQSAVFDSVLPEATRRFEASGVGVLVRTEAVGGEPPDPQRAIGSLELMRREMLTSTQPSAAVFIGGMEGIPAEHALYTELMPGRPTYPLGAPGGAARELAEHGVSRLQDLLRQSHVYPAIGRAIVEDIAKTLG